MTRVRSAAGAVTVLLGVFHLIQPAAVVGQDARTDVADVGPTAVADVLHAGDIITLSFEKESTFNGDFTVAGDGLVMLPLIGIQKVTDAPVDAVRDRLRQAYGTRLRNQQVLIILRRRVRIFGGISRPGLYHIDSTMRLGDAIAEAGGVTDDGKMDGIKILRGDLEFEANLTGDEILDPFLFSGDQVMVPEGSNAIFTVLRMVGGAALTALTWQFGRRAFR